MLACFVLNYSHCVQAEHPAGSRVARTEPQGLCVESGPLVPGAHLLGSGL